MTEHRILCLYEDMLCLAEAIAAEMYGCDLDRLDSEDLEFYGSLLTEDNLEEVANDLAAAAWQAY